jgi:predicted pyridoxine 5'-phosphate oxidase superfamily flavin-nucleotide-binding protein
MRDVFHSGEISVQERAGVRDRATKVGRVVAHRVERDAASFLEQQVFVVLGTVDALGRPWATPMSGAPGIVRVEDETTVILSGKVGASDLLHEHLAAPGPLAVLAIDLETRLRYRVNGVGEAVAPDRFRLTVREAFGNCPKYIQVRRLEAKTDTVAKRLSDSPALGDDQRRFIEAADTLFIATVAERGADASHRGGRPGFVRIDGDGTLVIPDYTGNNMFQTLGNIALVPMAGLLFVDFETGRTLQLTGGAAIDWDEGRARAFSGAHRLLRATPLRVIETRDALAVRGTLVEPSPFNP